MLLSTKTVRRILSHAATNKMLIITATDEIAANIKREISSAISAIFGKTVHSVIDIEGVHTSCYEVIYVMSIHRYNNSRRFNIEPFKGTVCVTVPDITQIKNIAKFYRIKIGDDDYDRAGIQTTPGYQQESVV